MSEKVSAYAMTKTELRKAYDRALELATEASTAAGPSAFPFKEARELSYYSGALHARKEGQKPPFDEGGKVRAKQSEVGTSVPRIVRRVQYDGGGLWTLFLDDEDHPYRAERFEKVPLR